MPISAPSNAYSMASCPDSSDLNLAQVAISCSMFTIASIPALARGSESRTSPCEELLDLRELEDPGNTGDGQERAQQRVLDQVLPVLITKQSFGCSLHKLSCGDVPLCSILVRRSGTHRGDTPRRV